ncbi:MAG: bacillithiol biosynthesis deacetylase BshB1 [Vicinamibacterales bacterium]
MSLDLLVFGPHPDDIEIGLGGSVALHVALGQTVGLCDLTRGELGTNGTAEERVAEAEEAASILGVKWRRNLGLPDGGVGDDASHVREIAAVIRGVRPRTIALPYWEDRHPDHVAASRLIATAAFRAGLSRYKAAGGAWKADWLVHYFINDSTAPSFVVDVSAHYESKRRALDCYRSQFNPSGPGAAPTRLTSPRFRQLIESRDAHFGALAGVTFAEGLVVREPLVRASLRLWTTHGDIERP